MVKLDKIGRKIPEFDRSNANRKGAVTRKEKDGNDVFSRIGSMGGSLRTRGYLGKLKDEGKIDELKELSKKGRESQKRNRTSDAGGK
jgi:hypothetical protein